MTLAMIASIFMLEHVRADIVWETHYADNAVISNNSMLTAGGTTVTFSTTVVSDNDTAEDIHDAGRLDFFTVESEINNPSGSQTGNIVLWFNNIAFDPNDYIELTMEFSQPLTSLQFALTDVDGDFTADTPWGDSVEVFYNTGISVQNDPSLYTLGSLVNVDDEDFLHGFEGIGNAGPNSTNGNVQIDFGGVAVNLLAIRYRSRDDSTGNPGAQHIGITDLTFAPVPEPAVGFAGIILALGGYALRRHSRSDPLPKT